MGAVYFFWSNNAPVTKNGSIFLVLLYMNFTSLYFSAMEIVLTHTLQPKKNPKLGKKHKRAVQNKTAIERKEFSAGFL